MFTQWKTVSTRMSPQSVALARQDIIRMLQHISNATRRQYMLPELCKMAVSIFDSVWDMSPQQLFKGKNCWWREPESMVAIESAMAAASCQVAWMHWTRTSIPLEKLVRAIAPTAVNSRLGDLTSSILQEELYQLCVMLARHFCSTLLR